MISGIIYKSTTGSCAKYAEEISRGMHAPAKPMGGVVRDGGKIIYVGWAFAGSVVGLKKAMKKYNVAAVVLVGMSPVYPNSVENTRSSNEIPSDVAVFCKQGGFNMNKLPLPLKLIMKMKNKDIVKRMESKGQRNEQEEALLKMASTGVGEPASWDVSDIVAWCAEN